MNRNPNTERRTIGFTLVEILTVIVIIAALAAIVLATTRKMRQSADNARCISNLRQIGPLLELYKQDHNNTYPSPGIKESGNSWKMWDSEDLAAYIYKGKKELNGADNETGTIWECPSAKRDLLSKGINPSNNNSGYGLNKALPSNPVWVEGQKQGPHSSAITPINLEYPERTALIMDCQHAICGPDTSSYNHVKAAATRHSDTINVLYADLSVRPVKLEVLPTPGSKDGNYFWTGKP